MNNLSRSFPWLILALGSVYLVLMMAPAENSAGRMQLQEMAKIPIVDDQGVPVAILSQRDVVAFIVSRMPKRILNLPPEPRLEARTPDGG